MRGEVLIPPTKLWKNINFYGALTWMPVLAVCMYDCIGSDMSTNWQLVFWTNMNAMTNQTKITSKTALIQHNIGIDSQKYQPLMSKQQLLNY